MTDDARNVQTGLVPAEVQNGLANGKLGDWTHCLFSSERPVCVSVRVEVTVVVGFYGLILGFGLHIIGAEKLFRLIRLRILLPRDQIKFILVCWSLRSAFMFGLRT